MKKQYCFLILLLSFTSLFADDKAIIELVNFRYRDFSYRNFYLEKKVNIRIESLGMGERWQDDMFAYGWINNLETRQVAWKMNKDNAKRWKVKYLWKYDNTIELPEGYYQVCYSVSPGNPRHGEYHNLGDFLDDLFNGFNNQNWRKGAHDWGIQLLVNEDNEKYVQTEGVFFDDKSILSIAPLSDSEYKKQGISLLEDAKLRVYAIGEGDEGEMYDYGWIEDAATGEHVWRMEYSKTGWAGGAEKNRIIDTVMEFKKGDYLVYFITDGSHSYEEWNRFPPYMPQYWGITLWGQDKDADWDKIVQPYDEDKNQQVIVDLTRVGDNRLKEKGFTIERPFKVRVRCLGEYGYSGSFVDYGWIIDADTRKVIWEMTRDNTDYAGGGKKNRMFNGSVALEPGNYIAFYRTDGSHSYRDWNTGPPYYPEAWGMEILVTDENFNPDWVDNYQEGRDENVIVAITRMGNRENESRQFKIDHEQDVRIYALGEGDDDTMYDFGRIEDEEGKVIWQMEYWNSEPAGGATKNLMANKIIRIKPGTYTVKYRTDGSHSYNNWNDDPPRDVTKWGITIYKMGE